MSVQGTTTQRGYGTKHQAERARWKPVVEAGGTLCAEPICLMDDRWIPPYAAWDLAHNRETGGYRGPAHRTCNRAEGGRWRHKLARLRGRRRVIL